MGDIITFPVQSTDGQIDAEIDERERLAALKRRAERLIQDLDWERQDHGWVIETIHYDTDY